MAFDVQKTAIDVDLMAFDVQKTAIGVSQTKPAFVTAGNEVMVNFSF